MAHHKSESTSKKREKLDSSANPTFSKESLELTSLGSTSTHSQSKQERKEAKRKRREERAKKREEKAKRKEEKAKRKEKKAKRRREKAKRSRESELRDTIDSTLPDTHDLFVINDLFQLKQKTHSQNEEDMDLQLATEIDDDRILSKGKPSTKKNRGHNLEIPATQEHRSSSPTPQIASEQPSDKRVAERYLSFNPKVKAESKTS